MPNRILFTLLMAIVISLFTPGKMMAQSNDSLNFFRAEQQVQTVLLMVMNLPDIVDYKNFKQQLEIEITTLGNNPAVPSAQRDSLKNMYCETKAAYDKVFDRIKHDLLDYKITQQMKKQPMAFASRYALTFDSAKTAYQNRLRPLMLRVSAGLSFKPIPPIVVSLGVQALQALVKYIGNRAELKNIAKTVMVNMVDTWFIDPIKMKSWETLVSYRPAAATASTAAETVADLQPATASRPAPETNLRVGVPTITASLKGAVRMTRYNTSASRKDSVQLKTATMKAISIRSLEDASQSTVSPWSFSTASPVAKNSDIQISVKSDCYIYVFALNKRADGSTFTFPVYPYTSSKAITIGSLGDLPSPVMDREPDGSLIIPRTPEGMKEQYMHIDGTSEYEELGIVFSRAEIDFNDLVNRIDFASGGLSDRLAAVFGSQAISAGAAGLRSEAAYTASFNAANAPENAVVALTLHIDVK